MHSKVLDLKPRTRATAVVGVLSWIGTESPEPQDLVGSRVLAVGLAPIEIFTQGDATVVGTINVISHKFAPPYSDFGVGTMTSVWGWRTALRKPFELNG